MLNINAKLIKLTYTNEVDILHNYCVICKGEVAAEN